MQRFPGLHLRELARHAQLEAKHVDFHMRRLEAASLVTSRAEDGFRRYYPTQETHVGRRESVDRHEKRALAMLRRPVPLHIMLLLLDRGEMDHASIKEATGVAHGTVSYHLRNLESQGLIVGRQDGRRSIFAPADAAGTEALLLRYRPPDELVQGFIEAWEAFAL